MNDFEWDALQKKRIARQEKYHNRKKRGCTLPSDNLSEAQRKKLNGEVKTLDLTRPIDYTEYIRLPKELQEMYYNHIVTEFVVGCPSIAEMMGVNTSTLRGHNVKSNIKIKTVTGKPSNKEIDRFERWWGKEDPQNEPQVEQECSEAVNYGSSKACEVSQLKRLAFEWHGVEEMDAVLKFLGNLPLPSKARIRVTIEEGNNENNA